MSMIACGPAPVQFAYLVSDLAAGMKMLRRHWALGPFFVIPDITIEDATYRGKPTELTFTVALAQAGEVQVELLLPQSNLPSAFSDVADGSDIKLHHAAVITEDFNATVEGYVRDGFEIANSGVAFGTMPFCYVDTRDYLGHMLEIIPASEAILDLYRRVRLAAVDWDGLDPVRNL